MSDNKKFSSLAIAEQKAQSIVREAQDRKKILVNEAIDVAEKELKVLKEKKEEELKNKVYDTTSEEQALKEATDKEIEHVFDAYIKNNQKALEFVMEKIVNVQTLMNKNIIADFDHLKPQGN
jgi:hypothetical protein